MPPLPKPSAEVAEEAFPGSPSASGEGGAAAEGAIQPSGFSRRFAYAGEP